jgi:hypothetical protein
MRRRGEEEEAHFEREWDGLGFGTGAEEQDGPATDASPVGTRGGRFPLRKRAGVAVAGVFVDGSQERGARGDEALEKAMRTAMGDAGRADPEA